MPQKSKPQARHQVAQDVSDAAPNKKSAAQRDVNTRMPRGSAQRQLPHERDESAASDQVSASDPMMAQALKDNQQGIVDTDRRSAYGLSDGLPEAKTKNSSIKSSKK